MGELIFEILINTEAEQQASRRSAMSLIKNVHQQIGKQTRSAKYGL